MNDERRQEILRHAIAIVAENGLGGLTMKKVAARVGFTEPAAYRYFPSKQALLAGIIHELGRRLLDPARTLAAGGGSAAARLEAVVRHHIDFVLELNGLPMLLLGEAAALGNEEVLTALREMMEGYLGIIDDLAAELPATSRTTRPRDLGLLLLGLPATLAIRRRLGADSKIERRVRDELLPYVIKCLART